MLKQPENTHLKTNLNTSAKGFVLVGCDPIALRQVPQTIVYSPPYI